MAFIERTEQDLLQFRQGEIQSLLRPLRDRPVSCKRKATRNEVIFAAYDGTDRNADMKSYRDYNFRTSVNSIYAQYFEIWKSSQGTRNFYLQRAYLNIFRTDTSRDLVELLCIHADPNEVDDKIYRFKKGTHLHVCAAEDPIPHCHFPLDYMAFDDMLVSCAALTESFSHAISILRDEVLARCGKKYATA